MRSGALHGKPKSRGEIPRGDVAAEFRSAAARDCRSWARLDLELRAALASATTRPKQGKGSGAVRSGRTTVVVILGICGLLAFAPQTAIAGKKKKAYEGTVATQGVYGQTP